MPNVYKYRIMRADDNSSGYKYRLSIWGVAKGWYEKYEDAFWTLKDARYAKSKTEQQLRSELGNVVLRKAEGSL